jgi:hypothetical protein
MKTSHKVTKMLRTVQKKKITEKKVVEEKELGQKFDNDKPRWELLPYKEVGEIVDVLTSGAKKYQDNQHGLMEKRRTPKLPNLI